MPSLPVRDTGSEDEDDDEGDGDGNKLLGLLPTIIRNPTQEAKAIRDAFRQLFVGAGEVEWQYDRI